MSGELTVDVIKKMEELIKQANKIEPVIEIDGKKVWRDSQKEVDFTKRITPLLVCSLAGLVELANNNNEGYSHSNLFFSIENFSSVGLYAYADEITRKRETIGTVELNHSNSVEEFEFDRWIPMEKFNIQLLTMFVQNEAVSSLFDVSSGLFYQAAKELKDTGMTQEDSVRAGTYSSNGKIPGAVRLRPYRTFVELEQPESPFLFRVNGSQDGVNCKLIEADGGAWKLKAVENIKEYLHTYCPDIQIIG